MTSKDYYRQNKYPLITVIRRELQRISSQWLYILSTTILPVVAFVLITAIFYKGVPRDLDIAVVDKDYSAFSRQITRKADATSIARVSYEVPTPDAAYRLMREGKIHAFLVIPEASSRKMIKKEAAPVILYVDNTNIITGGLLSNGLREVVNNLSGQIKLQSYMKKGLHPREASKAVSPVTIREHILFNPFGSYSFFLLTGLLPLMVIVFVFLNSLHTLGTELKYGTASELMKKANGSITVALAGKLLPFTAISLLHAILMNYIIFFYIGIPMNGNYTLIVASEVLLIIAYQLLAAALIAVTSNMRLSLSLGSAYTMMALTFAGLTFPITGMPAVAKLFSYIFPFRFWMEIFIGQTMRGEPVTLTMEPVLVMGLYIVAGILCIPLLKKRYSNKIYYGKI